MADHTDPGDYAEELIDYIQLEDDPQDAEASDDDDRAKLRQGR